LELIKRVLRVWPATRSSEVLTEERSVEMEGVEPSCK
jgi:hypothetical protein